MSLFKDLQEATDNLVPSHQIEISRVPGFLSALVHYIDDPAGFMEALHSEEGVAKGLLAHFTAKADEINRRAQRDLAQAQGLTNVPSYQELLDVFRHAIEQGTLPPSEPAAPPTATPPPSATAPGAPAPASTVIQGAAPQPVPSSIPGAPSLPAGVQVFTRPQAQHPTQAPNVAANDQLGGIGDTLTYTQPGQPSYEQLLATVQSLQANLAAQEQALTAIQAGTGIAAVQAGNASTAAQDGAESLGVPTTATGEPAS